MALNRPALVDALTDAGLEAEAVRRAVDVLEQSYADTANQAEMHLRFDAMEKSLADHDRLNEEQLAGINKQFEGTDKQFEGINKQFEGINKQFDAADKQSKSLGSRLQDFKDEVDRRFSDLKESMDREFAAVRSELAAVRNELGGEIASLRNEMTTEFAAVRNEMASLRSELNGKITMLQWMIGVLFVMQGTTLGIVIAKLL